MSDPLTRAEMEAILKRIRYRDVRFQILGMGSDYEICVWAARPDVITGRLDKLIMRQVLRAQMVPISERGFIDMIFRVVNSLEMHEIQEHFLVDWNYWLNPHPATPSPQPDWLVLTYRAADDAEEELKKKAAS